MTPRPYGASSYRVAELQTATPLELVVKLYDGALASTAAAREAMVRKDLVVRRSAMNKAMAIVSELQNTLDLERGGKIAAELDGLYTYVLSRLLEAIARQDVAPIDDAHRVLSVLREAWQQIATGAAPVAQPAGARP